MTHRLSWKPVLSKPAVAALALAVAVAGSGVHASAAHDSRFANMPAPEAFAEPAAPGDAQSAYDATYELSLATIKLRAGTYTLYRFTDTGVLLRQRTVRFTTAVRFRSSAQTRLIGNRYFTRVAGGTWRGWFVATPDAQPTSKTTFEQPRDVGLAKGSYAGLSFYANGRITTRRVATLYSAATVKATTVATFNGRQYLLMADGPLAGRWVAKAAVSSLQKAPTGSGSSGGTETTQTAPLVTWKTLVLLYRETDVTFKRADGSTYRLRARMSDNMYDMARQSIRRTVGTVQNWTGTMAALNMDIVDVPHPLTKLDTLGSGYWVSPWAVSPDLDLYAPAGRYDSVVVIFLPKDASGVTIPVPGWGLTLGPGPWANGAGFSSVKTPLQNWWWTDTPYPEEVFVHEWMHQVLIFHETTGHTDVDLHEEYKYGYSQVNGTYKAWLSAVMQGTVKDGSRYRGMDAAAWRAGKPTRP